MIYRNDSNAALDACERERTGNFGDDEYYDRKEEYIDYDGKNREKL